MHLFTRTTHVDAAACSRAPRVVARQIADKLNGKTSHAAFGGKGYCWLELGEGRAGFAGGDFVR